LANPSTLQTNTDQSEADQSEANQRQEEVKQVQEQNSKEVKQETGQPSESMVTEQVDAKKEEHGQEMLVENTGAQDLKDLKEETSPSSESMVTEQLDVEKEEHVPEMLGEDPEGAQKSKELEETGLPSSETTVTEQAEMKNDEHVPEIMVKNPGASQNSKDRKVETSLPSESMVTEQVDVEKEENVQEMLIENPGSTENVVQVNTAQGQVEQITQLERDTEEAKVPCATTDENELMETNQGDMENVVDELVVAVNDSTNLSEQGDNVECIETTSESMETDQLTSKEDGVTQEVTEVTTDQSHCQSLKGDVTDGEVVENALNSEQSNSTVSRAGAGTSDATMLQMSVAMEIDTQGENSDANSPTKVELSESETPLKHLQESEISLDREPNQGLNSGEDGTSTAMHVETMAECDTNGSVLQVADTSLEDSGLCTTPATNT